MEKSTQKTLGAGLLFVAVAGAVWAYKRSKGAMGSAVGALTPAQLRHARHVRQWAKWAGKDISQTPGAVEVEPVLPNGMTQKFARKYMGWLRERSERYGKKYTHKHISPSSMALPVGEAVR